MGRRKKDEFIDINEIANITGAQHATIRKWTSRGTRGFPQPVPYGRIWAENKKFEPSGFNSNYYRKREVMDWWGQEAERSPENRPGRRTKKEQKATELTEQAGKVGTSSDQFRFSPTSLPGSREPHFDQLDMFQQNEDGKEVPVQHERFQNNLAWSKEGRFSDPGTFIPKRLP